LCLGALGLGTPCCGSSGVIGLTLILLLVNMSALLCFACHWVVAAANVGLLFRVCECRPYVGNLVSILHYMVGRN